MLQSEKKIKLPNYINIPLTENNPHNTFPKMCVHMFMCVYINQFIHVYVCIYKSCMDHHLLKRKVILSRTAFATLSKINWPYF